MEYFSKELAQAFVNWGYEIFWLDFERLGLGAWKLRQAVQGKEAVFITFNFIGLSGEAELWELDSDGTAQVSIWEKAGIRCLNIMVDHPIYYYEQLRHPAVNMQTFCIDRDHAAYMKRFYPNVPCEFLPLAGNGMTGSVLSAPENLSAKADHSAPENLSSMPDHPSAAPDFMSESFEQWVARPYPLVFTANYVPISNIEYQLNRLEPEYRDFYYEIIEAFVRQPEKDLLTQTEAYMKREMPGLTNIELRMAMRTMTAVDLWIRTYFREKTVRILAEGGMPVHLFGKDWEKMPCKKPENLILHGNGHMLNSTECVQAMAQGKLALNTMPWFKDGVHDRIFTAMLQGAAALTDDSRYLREQFVDYETLVYYDLRKLENLPEQVHELLKEPERMYEISRRGYAVAKEYHTWKQRAEVLFRFVKLY